jgi:hypothetical protein
MTAIASFKMAMAFLQETNPIAAVIAQKPECPVAQGNVDAVTKNADNPSGVYRFVIDREPLRVPFFAKTTRRRFLKKPFRRRVASKASDKFLQFERIAKGRHIGRKVPGDNQIIFPWY